MNVHLSTTLCSLRSKLTCMLGVSGVHIFSSSPPASLFCTFASATKQAVNISSIWLRCSGLCHISGGLRDMISRSQYIQVL